jgi:hypothetical protein
MLINTTKQKQQQQHQKTTTNQPTPKQTPNEIARYKPI